MPSRSFSSAAVTFLDLEQVLDDLRRAAAEARREYPEIVRVLLFGSLVRGNWTAASDADLIVVARRPLIPTDTLVYSEREFEALWRRPGGFLPGALEGAVEL